MRQLRQLRQTRVGKALRVPHPCLILFEHETLSTYKEKTLILLRASYFNPVIIWEI